MNASNVMSSEDSAVIQLSETMRLGHVLSIMPSVALAQLGISAEVAGLLAVKHFNERSGQVLPGLPRLLDDCDIHLTWKPLDSELRPMPSVQKLLQNAPLTPSLQNPYPIAVLGAASTIASESLAIIGGVRNVPQCSCCATSRDLEKKAEHPYFTRTMPSGEGKAKAMAVYFHALGVTHAAILHVGQLYAQLFAKHFKDAM